MYIDNNINQSEWLVELNITTRKELSILSNDKIILGIEKWIMIKFKNTFDFLIVKVINKKIKKDQWIIYYLFTRNL